MMPASLRARFPTCIRDRQGLPPFRLPTCKTPLKTEHSGVVTFDTNVLVRLLVVDDADQCIRAERAWREAIDHDGVYLPMVVVELVWVLRIA